MTSETGSTAATLAVWVSRLSDLPPAVDDAEAIDRISALEGLKAAVFAAQAREIAAFADSQENAQRAQGVVGHRIGRGVGDQIGLATKTSPFTGSRQLNRARALVHEVPATLDLVGSGQVSEWVATIVARETAVLSPSDRRAVDAALAATLPGLAPREAAADVRRRVIATDTGAVVERASRARADRTVSVRPAPDTMAIVTALLPAEQGMAVWANLRSTALAARSAGDPRALGQLMADTLVERATGQARADAVPVEIGVVMPVDSLLDADDAPAELSGYGPIPAEFGRWLGTRAAQRAQSFIRRVFTDPVDHTVTSIDTRRRRFDGSLASLIRYRDRHCRDAFCTAPIADLDHIQPHAEGGPTSAANGQGLCRRGNLVKEMPGWTTTGDADERTTVTSTGHRYTSRPPPALGRSPDDDLQGPRSSPSAARQPAAHRPRIG